MLTRDLSFEMKPRGRHSYQQFAGDTIALTIRFRQFCYSLRSASNKSSLSGMSPGLFKTSM
jgi:hypothetical protein